MELQTFGTPNPDNVIKPYNPYEGKKDYSALRDAYSDDVPIWNDEQSLITNTITVINSCVTLPNPNHVPVVAAFILQPSMLIRKCGIMISLGSSGSGKSIIGKIAAKLHDAQILAGSSTYAAIRNVVNRKRWDDVASHRFEKGYCLVFDDLKRDAFLDKDKYTFFRCGTDRDTEMIEISSAIAGENLIFPSFGPKMFSTISGFVFDPEFEELLRRVIIIPHKSLKQTELEFVEPSDINFEPFREAFLAAYGDDLDEEFLALHKSLKRPKGINNLQWQITKPLISTLAHLGWGDKKECTELLIDYWQGMKPPKSELFTILEGEINSEYDTFSKNCEYQNLDPYDIEFDIDPAQIKKIIDAAYSGGILAEKPSGYLIRDTMAELGYTLKLSSRKKMSWLKVN